ncbi:MAG: EF-hand domain-containing protein [Rhizobiaceae bacterium]|nr:EF-hand domain-containing protein [Rhizobiaceae bacterium]
MNGKKLLLVGLSATLLAGGAVQASFAAAQGQGGTNWHHGGRHGGGPRIPPEVAYVRMLKQFNTNGDMKISKDEMKAGVDKIFDEIDTNKDGQITPGELRAYHEARVKQWRAEHAKANGDDAAKTDQSGDQAKADDQGGKGQHHGHRPGGPRAHFMREAFLIRGMLMFHRIDTDENGQISKQEAEAAADKFFDRMDRNHDGVISLDDMPDRPLF